MWVFRAGKTFMPYLTRNYLPCDERFADGDASAAGHVLPSLLLAAQKEVQSGFGRQSVNRWAWYAGSCSSYFRWQSTGLWGGL